jgi:hypothetical protein
MWLLIFTNASDIESIWNRLLRNLVGHLDILRIYLQFDTSDQIRPKPIQPHHVVIHQT